MCETYHTTRISSDTVVLHALCVTNSQPTQYVSTKQINIFPLGTATRVHILYIQGDQKVSVHLMITVHKTQKYFKHFLSQ
jgi:hypothetical protein